MSRLTFYGAVEGVTGSAYLLETDTSKVFLDCGLFQGRREEEKANQVSFSFKPGALDAVVLSHAWLDHSARLPKLVFSGDLGNSCAALWRDPEVVEDADVLLLESTCGDRNHRPMDQTLEEFEDIVEQASANGVNILIPAFAVGRTQEMIFRLGELYQKGKLRQQAVYLNSPMAIAVTEIYHRYQHVYNSEDTKAMQQAKTRSLHSFLPILRYTTKTAESISLNKITAGAIIIAGSGMCNGGRIRHHFKQNLWRNNAHVIMVGFQANGTPGRKLVDGEKTFRLGDETIAVKARIHTLGGFSAHAGQSQLLDWINHFKTPHPRLYLIHGEDKAKIALLGQAGWSASIPGKDETIWF